MMIGCRWLGMVLVVALSCADASNCEAPKRKQLLYQALDTMLEHPYWEPSEKAIGNYHQVIQTGKGRRYDKAAVELSCTLLTRMLYRAGQFHARSELYASCGADLVQTALAMQMPDADPLSDEPYEDFLPIVRLEPDYPPKASKREQNGIVVVEFTVNASGRVVADRVIASSDRVFEKEALRAVKKYRYKPRVVKGEAVPTPGVLLKFTFTRPDNPAPYTRDCR